MGIVKVAPKPTMTYEYRTASVPQRDDYHDLLDKNGKVIVERLVKAAKEPHAGSDREIDAFIAKELNKLSMQERQKLFEEIHGVDNVIQETPEFISEKLDMLEEEVEKINPKNAYEMALEKSADFVADESFRVSFLRADMFDPVKASKRLVTFFECRLALFGPDLLTRTLTLKDLNADDMACLKSGYFQILSSRDTAGRAVLAQTQGMFKRSYKLALNMQRMYHYLMCAMAEDMETQRHGYIFVMYQIGKYEYDPPPDLFNGRTNLFMQGSPVRLCGMHMCFDNPVMKSLMRVILAVSGPDARARNRFHEGSHTEVQYRLLSFGIPVDLFPITGEGELKKTLHMKWLAMRRAKESARTDTTALHHFASSTKENDEINLQIDLPGRNDVLMGKGKPLQDHSGNVALRALVNLYLDDYNASKKHQKGNYVKKVHSIIQSKSGRFLKRNANGWWTVAKEDEAREKIGKTFTSELFKIKRSKSALQSAESEYCQKRSRVEDQCNCFGGAFHGIPCCDLDQSVINEPYNNNNLHMPKRQK